MPWLYTVTAEKLPEMTEQFTPHAIIGEAGQRTRIVGKIEESQSRPGFIRIETEYGDLEFSKNQTLTIKGEHIPITKGSPRDFRTY